MKVTIVKAYGFQRDDAFDRGEDEPDEGPLHLREVALVADPLALRQIASFISRCADLIDQYGTGFDHEHLRSNWPDWKEGDSDLIIARKQK